MSKNAVHNNFLRVRRKGVEESLLDDVYHRLLRMSWPRFFSLMVVIYLAVNTVFAALYAVIPGGVANIERGDFLNFLAFSVQTMSTVGYGHFYPITQSANALITIQSAVGLFFTAVLTGLVFAKFSTPLVRIVFSRNILHTLLNGRPVLSLRVGNFRANHIYEGRARLTLLRDEITSEGERLRRMIDLKLIRDTTPLFALSWTLFHPLDDSSPLQGLSLEEIRAARHEFFATFIGFEQDLERDVVAHNFYDAASVVRAKKFADMITVVGDVREVDFSRLHEIEPQNFP